MEKMPGSQKTSQYFGELGSRALRQHLVDHQIGHTPTGGRDIRPGFRARRGRSGRVRSGCMRRDHAQHLQFVFERETVAGLRFDGGGSAGVKPVQRSRRAASSSWSSVAARVCAHRGADASASRCDLGVGRALGCAARTRRRDCRRRPDACAHRRIRASPRAARRRSPNRCADDGSISARVPNVIDAAVFDQHRAVGE